MKLRNCSAHVDYEAVFTVLGRDRTRYVLHDALILTSYDSIVAAYSNGRLYLLPYHNYSKTTWMHVRKFVEDYCDGIQCGTKSYLYSNDDVIMCDSYIVDDMFLCYC